MYEPFLMSMERYIFIYIYHSSKKYAHILSILSYIYVYSFVKKVCTYTKHTSLYLFIHIPICQKKVSTCTF